MPGSRYKVRVTKDYLVFCSGHFITYAGDQCERVHGHNYRVAVEVEDALDENHYVFDFIALKDLTKGIIDEIDHRMLLPTQSSLIRLEDEGPNWRVRYGERSWSFPRDECALLPIANIDEIRTLERAGADAVLVGSALHDGRIGPREIAELSGHS